MANGSVLQGIMNPAIADPVGGFRQGEQTRKNRLADEQVSAILNETIGGKIGKLSQLDPDLALKLSETFQIPVGQKDRLDSMMGDVRSSAAILRSAGPEAAAQFLGEKIALLDQLGIQAPQYLEMAQRLRDGDPSAAEELLTLDGAVSQLTKTDKPAGQVEFEALIEGFTPEEQKRAKRIKAGIEARAVGSATQTIAEEGTAEEVAETEEILAAGKEAGKLKAQFKLSPKVKEAVEIAVGSARLLAKRSEEARSDENAFNLYNTAMAGLVEGLEGADTGPFVGLLPAVTANQQIAEGAVAAMTPILKSLFRTSGEGTFTDKDQELLLAMVPTRKDLAEARESKLSNIDSIIRTKLRQPQQTSGQQTDTPQRNIVVDF